MTKRILIFLLITSSPGVKTNAQEQYRIVVGSKKFTESVIIGEIVTDLINHSGNIAIHRKELGGTRILWKALRNGDVDVYPEYSGTLLKEIFNEESLSKSDLPEKLEKYGILMSRPLGFENTYALGMKYKLSADLGIQTISDLRNYPDLKFGFTNEFMDRGDGWPGLQKYYTLPQQDVRGLDHDLAYRGLESGTIQVIDMYSTDAEIDYYKLRPLQDDLHFFPDYDAILLYRKDLLKKAPEAVPSILRLENRISGAEMIIMNSQAKINKIPEDQVAADFLYENFKIVSDITEETLFSRFRKHTVEHLILVLISLSGAIIVAVPLGIAAVKKKKIGQVILGFAGIIQTIPSLALLVFMIPLLGIGGPPAVCALFLYSLLPIVRNTHAGIKSIEPGLQESARALGLSDYAILRFIEIPLASRSILAGIKTSAVINVGTATLGALIGAGGYGQPILTGIRLDDTGLILQGAVPAAVLALLVQGGFDLLEKLLVPKGLRLQK